MLTLAQELRHRTLVYWRLSSSFNGRNEEKIPFIMASNMCNVTYMSFDHKRPLVQASERLLNNIVRGESPRNLVPGKVKWLSKHRA
jgi:hypothetical protein